MTTPLYQMSIWQFIDAVSKQLNVLLNELDSLPSDTEERQLITLIMGYLDGFREANPNNPDIALTMGYIGYCMGRLSEREGWSLPPVDLDPRIWGSDEPIQSE